MRLNLGQPIHVRVDHRGVPFVGCFLSFAWHYFTIAAALDLREEPGQPLLQTLINILRSRRLLLLLDNCEHLIAGCAVTADKLLRTTSQVVILATSREPLGVPGEVVVPVPALSLPPAQLPSSPEELADCEAAQWFVARAQAIKPAFTATAANVLALARICRRLDGIALALELAAARLRVLPIEQLADRLEESLRLLSGGARTALPRHQTLTALIDVSHPRDLKRHKRTSQIVELS